MRGRFKEWKCPQLYKNQAIPKYSNETFKYLFEKPVSLSILKGSNSDYPNGLFTTSMLLIILKLLATKSIKIFAHLPHWYLLCRLIFCYLQYWKMPLKDTDLLIPLVSSNTWLHYWNIFRIASSQNISSYRIV